MYREFTAFEEGRRIKRTEEADQFRDQARPSRLVAGAESGTIITVEKFVEEDVVSPVRVILKLLCTAIDGAMAMLIPQKEAGKPVGNFFGYFEEV